MRHRTLAAAILIPALGALSLSACASDDSGGGGDQAGGSCETGSDIKTVEAAGGQGGGGLDIPDGLEDTGETYTIGYQGVLTGANQQLGINEANAVQLAITQANDSGTLPFTLEYAESDDEAAPDKSPQAAQKLIDNDEIVAVVGPMFSGPTNAAEPLYSEAGLMSLSPSSTDPSLTQQGFTTFARMVPPDAVQGTEAAALLEQHASHVFIVDDTSDYGAGLADVLEQKLKDDGMEVDRDSANAEQTQDYSSLAQQVKSSGADALYYAGYYQAASLFAKALTTAGFDCLKMSDDGTNDDQFIAAAGPDSEGWVFTCPCADARVDPAAQDFLDAYKTEFGQDPGTYSPEAYDATNAIIQAMVDMDGPITRESMVDAVMNIEYQGLTKEVSFTDTGEIGAQTVFLYGVEDGQRILKGVTSDLVE